MKKVFAIALALALALVGTVGFADSPVEFSGNTTDGPVTSFEVAYSVADVICVEISWNKTSDDLDPIAYTWDPEEKTWGTSAVNQDITFTINNYGFANMNVELAHTTDPDNFEFANISGFSGGVVVDGQGEDIPEAAVETLTIAPLTEEELEEITDWTEVDGTLDITITATISAVTEGEAA